MAARSYMPIIKRLYSVAYTLGLPVNFTESTLERDSRTIFIVRASVGNLWGEVHGPNRREAKTRACVLVLRLLDANKNQVNADGDTDVQPHSCPDFGLGKDPCTRLSELLMARKHPPAQYRLLEGMVAGDQWVFSMEVSLDQYTAVGKGGSKKEARRRATAALLQMMGYTVPEEDLAPPAPQTTAEPAPEQENTLENQTPNQTASAQESRCILPAHILPDFRLEKDPSTRLSELQMIRREKPPEYRTVSGELVNGSWVFTMEVSLDQYTASGSGRSKKEAKRSASTALLLMMGFTVPEKDLLREKPAKTPDETPDFHKGPVENSEDLETPTETQDQVEAEKLQTPEDEYRPVESPEEDQNPEPVLAAESTQALEILGLSEEELGEEDGQELQCLEFTEEEHRFLQSFDGNWTDNGGLDEHPEQEATQKSEHLEKELMKDLDSAPESREAPASRAPETVGLSEEEQNIASEETGLKLQSREDSVPEESQEQLDCNSEGDQSLSLMEVQKHLQTPAEEPNPEEVEPQIIEDLIVENKCEKLQTEEPASAPEPTAAPQASQTLSSVESLVIHALVKKLLQKLPARMRSYHDTVVETLEKALDQFRIPDGVYLKPKNIKKLGKAGARDLIYEYGSVCKLLEMALRPEPTEFQQDAMKHLNMRLTTFRNRPRTGLARFFSKWDKPKKRAC